MHSSVCRTVARQVLNSDGSQLVKACGTNKPAVLKSSGNKMTVVFHSDGSVVAKGVVSTGVSLTLTTITRILGLMEGGGGGRGGDLGGGHLAGLPQELPQQQAGAS